VKGLGPYSLPDFGGPDVVEEADKEVVCPKHAILSFNDRRTLEETCIPYEKPSRAKNVHPRHEGSEARLTKVVGSE